MPTNLVVVELTGQCRLVLRRFRFRQDGEEHRHDAHVVIDENAKKSLKRLRTLTQKTNRP